MAGVPEANYTEPLFPSVEAPIAAPAFNGTQPYVISNYVIGSLDLAILVLSVFCIALQLRKRKGLRDGGPSMLFIHVALFAACRAVLVFLPPKFYQKTQANPPFQVFLNVLPECLFLSIFVILNCMWTEIFLRIRRVNREVTRRIFLYSYFAGLAFLVTGAIVLIVCVKVTGIGATAGLPFWESASTYENLYYGVTALILVVANIIFGFGVLRRLPTMTPAYTQRLFSKMSKIRGLVIVTFICVVIKVGYVFVVQSYVTQAFKYQIISRDGFGAIWFFYLFITEVVSVFTILALFVFRGPQKTGRAFLVSGKGTVDSSNDRQLDYNEYTNLLRVRQN